MGTGRLARLTLSIEFQGKGYDRPQHFGRARLLRRYRRASFAPLQNGYLRHTRTAAGRGGALPRFGCQGHLRTLHGRARCPDPVAQEPRPLHPGLGFRPRLCTYARPPGERRRSQATWAPTKNSGASTMPANWCDGVPSPTAGPYSWTREPQTSSSRSSCTRRFSKWPARKRDSR